MVNIKKGQSYWYREVICDMYPFVSGEFKPVERHTNASSADALKQEWDLKAVAFCKFSVTVYA